MSTRLSKVILSVVTGRALLDVQLEMGYGYTTRGSSTRFYKAHGPDPAPGFLSCQVDACFQGGKLGSQVKTGVYLVGQKPRWAGSMTANVSPPLRLQLPSEKRLFRSF